AACSHLKSGGVEPILGLLTRDLNRIALQSQMLGALSMGVDNVLCIAGRHQALTTSDTAKGVFDLDPIQLVRILNAMRTEGKLADGTELESPVNMLVGTDTNPFADPIELQAMALDKAVAAGADFIMTHPVFNLDRFNAWMTYVRERGLHTKTCVIASVMPLTSSQQAISLAEKYKHLDIPDSIVERLDSAQDQKSAGVHLAAEIIEYVRKVDGVCGVHIMTGADFELALEVLAASGLSRS
ncbi:MAG: methylenetetrahydrofolate reductase, partial [Armatimonadota bacterium]|nr:methylenetetrahydrofolate reductase [Armatimonadota bacterium]